MDQFDTFHMPVISISIDLSSFGIFTRNTHCDWSPYCMNTMWVNTILSMITLFEYFIYLLLFCSTYMYQPSFDHYELNCHHQSVFWIWLTLLKTLFLYSMNSSLFFVRWIRTFSHLVMIDYEIYHNQGQILAISEWNNVSVIATYIFTSYPSTFSTFIDTFIFILSNSLIWIVPFVLLTR